jgi:hypothetical protein
VPPRYDEKGCFVRILRPVPIAIGFSLILLTGVADATSTTCTTSVVCAEYINSSSGVAIHGEANTGIGIRGTSNGSTGFYGASRSGSPFFPGVEGESLDQTGDDIAGGFGLTAASGGTAPAYGVVGYGSVTGVYGVAAGPGNGTQGLPTGYGIEGYDTAGIAGRDTNVAVLGQTKHGAAMLALANATPSNTQAFTPYGLTFPYAIAAEAEPDQTNGGAVAVEAVSNSIPLEAYNPTTGYYVELDLAGYDISAQNFKVDTSGNVTATSLATNSGSYVRTTGSSGTTRKSYSAQTAAPVMEDSGEGQLVNGRGYVKLDAALSDVIDNHNAYRVFLTPEGDSNGLYVTQKSPAGFVVREARGGRSTLSFDYRIIAKPVDDDAQRLALAPPRPHPDLRQGNLHAGRAAAAQESLDPFARLRSRVGPATFARERNAARAIETAP